MELYAKGQLSFLILTCMLDRDFYGLDIITEISNRSNGKIQLKKPSVYSNLTRMEQQGYISSYLQSSDFGPNRKYYSITEEGRNFYKELKEYFDKNNIDVFKFFENESGTKVIAQTFDDIAKKPTLSQVEQTENDEKEEDFFDFSSIDSPSESIKDDNTLETVEKASVIEQTIVDTEKASIQECVNEDDQSSNVQLDENATISKQEDSSNYSLRVVLVKSKEESLAEVESSTEHSAQKEEKKDDAVFLSNEDASEYNKRLYDISKEINRFKKKRSFAEDQISIGSTDALNSSNEKKKANLEELRNVINESKEKPQDNFDAYYFTRKANRTPHIEQPIEESKEEVKDDAVFVTGRYDISQVEKVKKIDPPRLKIISEYTRDAKLPTPKRDTSIDPSHKEILTKLYSKTRDNSPAEEREDSIYDYDDLKDFYTSQNIAFNVYKKPSERVLHNTNKLYFINALINFLLICGVSLISYFVLNALDWINVKFNFIYFVFPAILFINVCHRYYISRKYKGWHPAPMIAQWNIWGMMLLGLVMAFGVNFIFGFDFTNIAQFATTLIVPCVSLFVVLPIRYYVKRKILVKYWK